MKHNIRYCIGSRLRRLSRIADAYFRSQIADFNITENQMTILFALNELGKVEQGKIGKNLILERSTVSRNINLLEKRNYVSRTLTYRPAIELTKEGKDLVKTLIPLWENAMDELINKIEKEGVKSIEYLEKRLT